MYSKEIITAPIADATILRDVVDRPSACGAFIFKAMRKLCKHGLREIPLYNVWCSMKQRCLNKNHLVYKHYGGRGITIHEEWMKFTPFKEWSLLNGYKLGLTIERVNNNGNYEPLNCAWVTQSEQVRNKRTSVKITFNGETLCQRDWANKIGISNTSFMKRLKKWPLEKAMTIGSCSAVKNSKFIGVSHFVTRFKSRRGIKEYFSIKAYIHVNGKKKHLGCFKTEEEAAKAHDIAARKYYGENAKLNFPTSVENMKF